MHAASGMGKFCFTRHGAFMRVELQLRNLAGGLELDVALSEVQRMLESLTTGTTVKLIAPPETPPETESSDRP